jgi:TolB-like protein/DNA-binding winged helix-turn-helix (wHTH) protein/tetratricopeptide (TPR) repeat protein
MSFNDRGFLEFGRFRIDIAQRVLMQDDDIVPLAPKVFDTLFTLVASHGRIIEKEELLKTVWPDTFVEEGSLARNVSTIRRALGDNTATETYIETVPKRGYRFVARVRVVPTAGGQPALVSAATGVAAADNLSSSDGGSDVTGSRRQREGAVAQGLAADGRMSTESVVRTGWPWKWVGASLFALTITGGFFVWSGVAARTGVTPTIRSIAVIPLQNLSGDPDQEFVADGTTEELIATLSQVRSLRVIARTSVTRYKGTTKSVSEIGRELDVDAVLEGAVRQSTGRIRVTTQLVDVVTNETLWSKSYEGGVADLLAIQGDVARAVVGAMRAPTTPAESARLTRPRNVNPMAHAEILKGHALRWTGSDDNWRKALGHYIRAVELEPDAAVAHAGMAIAWQLLSGSSGIEPGRRAAERAVALDPELAEAHAAMADAFYRDYEFEAGHAESAVALALSPGALDGCFCYAIVLAATGRDRDALVVADTGIARNPQASAAHFARGLALYFSRQFEAAARTLTRAIELDRDSMGPRNMLSRAYAALGRGADAIATLDTPALRNTPRMVIAYSRAGRRTEALQLVQRLAAVNPPQESIFMAQAYAALGENEAALAWLTRSVDARETRAFWVIDEAFDGLRYDSRFAALVKRLKLPPSYYSFLAAHGFGAGVS